MTNPPIDPIREEIVTASVTFVGSEGNLTQPGPESSRMIKFESPLVGDNVVRKLQGDLPNGFLSVTLPIQFSSTSFNGEGNFLQSGLDRLFKERMKRLTQV